jgi:hypothetical protein
MMTKMAIDNLCCNGLVMEKRVEKSTPICRSCSSHFKGWLAQSILAFPTVTHQLIFMHGNIYVLIILVFSFDKTLLQYNLRNKYTRREFRPSAMQP